MRILVLTINYWPEKTGIGAVVTRRCEYLAAAGHEVTVCTGMPYYPEWQVDATYRGKAFCREKRNGVDILRSWIWVPQRVTSKKRILFEASFLSTSLLRALGARKPDLLLVVSPPLGLAVSARILSRWSGAPYVYDVEDLQPDAAADLQMLPKSVLPLLYRLEALAYGRASLITTVTEGMRQRIIAKGVPAGRVAVVPPPADRKLFDVGSAEQAQAFRRKHGLQGKFLVVHSGNMGVKQGLELVLEAALKLKRRPEISFLLVGDGAMKPYLRDRAQTLELHNLRFLPLQEERDFFSMLAATNVALIVQQPSVSDIAFPSKTVTLLAASRPIVASVSSNSEIARVLERSQAGIVTEPGNSSALTEVLLKLLPDPARRDAMAANARSYARQHWDEDVILPAFETQLLGAAGQSAPETLMAEDSAAA